MMSGSSSSATVRVDKATSDLLMNPDWAMNMDICDYVNTYPGQARDVLKAVKKRLQHKSPKVQFLALTLLETMVKNCGDYVHFQIVDKNILDDMVKIVKKKTDMNIRDKTLVLLDAWQEAFGGRGGKYPQYYYAYDELRRSGVQFPQRSSLAAPPIFTPPVAHPVTTHVQGYGMPSNSSRRLDEAMASERESLSMSTLDSMQNVTEVLSDMLQAMNPGDAVATKDDVVVDLVDRCRANQKKLMQMLTTTEDEELLGRGLELHDSMQTLLAKHVAIASGSAMPSQTTNLVPQTAERCSLRLDENETKQDKSPRPSASPTASAATATSRGFIDAEEEEDDDFAQLARRHSKPQPTSQRTAETAESSSSPLEFPAATSKALALPDPPAPVRTGREQDMIDLLSLALTTTSPYVQDTHQSPATSQNLPVSPNGPSDAYAARADPSNGQVQVPLQSYVVPWAQPQIQQQSFTQLPQPRSFKQQQPQQPFMQQSQQQPFMQPSTQQPPQQSFPQQQPQQQSFPQQMRQHPSQQQPYIQPPQQQSHMQQQHYTPNTYGYPPPPWASSSSSSSNYQNPANSTFQTVGTEPSYITREGIKPSLQSSNSFSSRGSNGPNLSSNPVNGSSLTGQKPYIPPYRLFEDLNVLGNRESGNQTTGSSASSTSLSGQNKVGGWR